MAGKPADIWDPIVVCGKLVSRAIADAVQSIRRAAGCEMQSWEMRRGRSRRQPRGGQHENLGAKSLGDPDDRAAGGKGVVAVRTGARGHPRRIRTLEDGPVQLGPLGQGRPDRCTEPDYPSEA